MHETLEYVASSGLEGLEEFKHDYDVARRHLVSEVNRNKYLVPRRVV
jgi:hypothetical protein